MKFRNEYVDERTGITYTLKGDYYFPNLSIPKDTNFNIGRYGKAHLGHIKQYNKPLYIDLLLDGKLNQYLYSIDEKCNTLLASIINELTKKENITEELKISNQLEWVAKMNNIKNRAEEIVYNEYVYN